MVCMLLSSVHWFIVAIGYLGGIGIWTFVPFLLILSLFAFRSSRQWLKKTYDFLRQHKVAVTVAAVLVQLLFIVSAELLIRRDATVVFQGAFKISAERSISNYLTRNPNNMALFLYERFFYEVFGFWGLWVMQGINLFLTNWTGWILYKGVKRHFQEKAADATFFLYMALAAFSPYFYSMYTDFLALPLTALQLIWTLDLFGMENRPAIFKQTFVLGLVTALAMVFRPTTIILVIAFLGVLIFKTDWKKCLIIVSSFSLSFGLAYGAMDWGIKHQQVVPIVEGEGLAKGPLLFINLGLTKNGGDQDDMKEGLLQYIEPEKRSQYQNGMFRTENVIKEIKRRLKEYTIPSFLYHLLLKQSLTVSEGTLGWLYRDIDHEKSAVLNPLYKFTKDSAFFQGVRTYFLSIDQEEYQYYAFVKQLIWIGMAFGLILVFLDFKRDDRIVFLALSVFGGLLFLQIFEGGKTRYLIQFLPQILILSGLGLAEGPGHKLSFLRLKKGLRGKKLRG